MDKHVIGENAGILWRLLNQDNQRKWELQEVKKATGFDDMELASAIGWLAREDKIQFELDKHNTKADNAYIYLMLNVYICLPYLYTQYCKKKFYLPQTLGIFIVITATLFFLFEVCGYCILISAGYCVDKCLGIELEFQEEAF